MRHRQPTCCAFAALGLLLGFMQPVFCQQSMVTLTVVDSLDRPVKDVEVSWGLEKSQSLTDEKGTVQIVEKKGSDLRLSATKRFTWVYMSLGPDALKWPLRLKLPPKLTAESEAKSPRISVKVVNTDGIPVAGANVAWDYVSLHPSKVQWKPTDSEGAVELRNGEGAAALRLRTAECSFQLSLLMWQHPIKLSSRPRKPTLIKPA